MYAILSREELWFPDVEEADETGLLAIGGDLSLERLKLAYSRGIFPWFNEEPVLWWSPDPRMVLFPGKMIISHSLRQIIRRNEFEIRYDTQFENVIRSCAETPRGHEDGTWITNSMVNAYNRMHKAGYAHSVEAFRNGELVGGLYGIAIGKAFFGESMFHLVPNASKIALYHLSELLKEWDFSIIDAQVYTNHLESLGGAMIPRKAYISLLDKALEQPGIYGNWNLVT
ncbi:MAG: leucyl/phenylalanyl-tRNA--protein transferase [Bacteroidales bacterium]